MTGRLGQLIDRTLGRAPVLQLLQPSAFASERRAASVKVTSLMARQDDENTARSPSRGTAIPDSTALKAMAAAPAPVRLQARREPASDLGARATKISETVETRFRRVEEIRHEESRAAAHDATNSPSAPPPRNPAPAARPSVETSPSTGWREAPREPRAAQQLLREVLLPGPGADEAQAARSPRPPSPVAPPSLVSQPALRGAAIAAPAVVEREPAIHITIGRVEVRALASASSARPPARRVAPRVSLDEYLRQRERGR